MTTMKETVQKKISLAGGLTGLHFTNIVVMALIISHWWALIITGEAMLSSL